MTDYRERVVTEVLGDVEVFELASSPDGPWRYRSLTVYRYGNEIAVHDVDGVPIKRIQIPAQPPAQYRNHKHWLREKLDTMHTDSLEEL